MESNKPTWKGTLSETGNDKHFEGKMEERRLELMNRQVAKINIQTVIAWCRDMSHKAKKQPGKELFASRCEQVVSDMVQVSEEYKKMERELEVSRQRNMDLERTSILLKTENMQMQKIIENLSGELTQFHPDWKEDPKERSGFNIIG